MYAATNYVLMARQRIVDSAEHYCGCELLFRSSSVSGCADFNSGGLATSDVLINLCSGLASSLALALSRIIPTYLSFLLDAYYYQILSSLSRKKPYWWKYWKTFEYCYKSRATING